VDNIYPLLVGKSEGRFMRRWEDNIKMDIKDSGYSSMKWIQ